MKKKIYNVCDGCGLEANRLTCLKKYGREPLKAKSDNSTYHRGKCDVCGNITLITRIKDYFDPDFSLMDLERE